MAQQVCFRRRFPLGCVMVLAALLGWLALPGPTIAQEAQQPGEEAGGVAVSAFTFEPAALTVHVGESVTWVNTDGVPHTTTAISGHQWGRLMTTGEAFTYTFDTPGTYAYFCEMHPAMMGTIDVVAE
jgi:plastocyanin